MIVASGRKLYPHVHMSSPKLQHHAIVLQKLYASHRERLAKHAAKKGDGYIISLWIKNDTIVLNSYPYHMVPLDISIWFESVQTTSSGNMMVTCGDATLLVAAH